MLYHSVSELPGVWSVPVGPELEPLPLGGDRACFGTHGLRSSLKERDRSSGRHHLRPRDHDPGLFLVDHTAFGEVRVRGSSRVHLGPRTGAAPVVASSCVRSDRSDGAQRRDGRPVRPAARTCRPVLAEGVPSTATRCWWPEPRRGSGWPLGVRLPTSAPRSATGLLSAQLSPQANLVHANSDLAAH